MTTPEHHFVADSITARRMARADFAFRFRGMVVLYSLMGAYALFAGVAAVLLQSSAIGFLALMFGLLAAVGALSSVLMFTRLRASAEALYTSGAEFTARYGSVLELRSPGSETMIPYPTIFGVRRSRRGVLIASGVRSSYTLPTELCPAEAYAGIKTARRTAYAPTPDVSAFTHVVAVDSAFLRAIGRRCWHRYVTEPSFWALGPLLVFMGVLLAFMGLPVWGAVLLVVLALVLAAVALVAFVQLGSARIRNSFRGQTVFARFDDDGFAVLDRGVYTWRRFDAVRSFQVVGAAVEFVSTASPDPELLPATLFPDDIRSRFAPAGSSVS